MAITPDNSPGRFTSVEERLFRAGKCCWLVSYGMVTPTSTAGKLGYCVRPSKPGADFGYCLEHEAEMAEEARDRHAAGL